MNSTRLCFWRYEAGKNRETGPSSARRVHWARQWINFLFGPSEQREELALPPDLPVLHLRRVSLSDKNRPIEYVEGYYDMRRMEFYLELRR